MNFLAHLYFADNTPQSMIGSLAPDFLRGPNRRQHHPALSEGIALHRCIDTIADTHPIPLRTRRQLRARHNLFAPILVDVFYDHALATQWHLWHAQPLDQFVSHAYQTMLDSAHLMPPPMKPIIARMAQQNWLGSYAHIHGMHARLSQMSQRFAQCFGKTFDAPRALNDLRAINESLIVDFNGFFPQLISQVNAPQAAI